MRMSEVSSNGQVRFLQVGRAYVNARIGLPRVWRLLWAQQPEFLGSEGKNVHRAVGWIDRLPLPLRRGVRASTGTLRFALARVGRGRQAAGALDLPLDAEVALLRRSGAVKLLDTRRARVVTLMRSPGQERKLRERIDSARAASAYPFAPEVLEVAQDEGWFAEEFVRGTHPTAHRGCHEGFGEVYLPLLVAFARAEEPSLRSVGAYAAELAAEILAPDGLLARLPAPDRTLVTEFVRDHCRKLRDGPGGDVPLPLVMSHGDFYSGNLVATPEGRLRAIDWAHLGRRSPLFDLLFVVMNHCAKVLSAERLRERIAEVVEEYRARLAAEDPVRFAQLDPALSARDELRWLFYLEVVHVPLRFCDDPGDRYVSAMLGRVRSFHAFEAAIGAVA
jgi:hypothetical protein